MASGKTTLARCLAEIETGVVLTVGDLIGDLMRVGAIDRPKRSDLQLFGYDLVRDQPTVLAERIKRAGEGVDLLLVDGLRAVSVAVALREILGPDHLKVVFLDAPRHERKRRFETRAEARTTAFDDVDDSPIELLTEAFREDADLIADATARPCDLALAVRPLLREFGHSP